MRETYRVMLLILLVYSAYTDIKRKEIMMIPVYMCILLSIFGMFIPNVGEQSSIIGLIPGVVILMLSYITKGAIGEGDAYLIMVVGLLTDIHMVIGVLVVSSIMASIYSLLALLIHRVHRGYSIPFAPFILSGFLGVISFV